MRMMNYNDFDDDYENDDDDDDDDDDGDDGRSTGWLCVWDWPRRPPDDLTP